MIITCLISGHFPELLILKYFYRKSTVTNNIFYERKYRFFNDGNFKNDLKSIPLENNLLKLTCQQVQRLICFSNNLIPCQINMHQFTNFQKKRAIT